MKFLEKSMAVLLALILCAGTVAPAFASYVCPECKWTDGNHAPECSCYSSASKDEGKQPDKPADKGENPDKTEVKDDPKPAGKCEECGGENGKHSESCPNNPDKKPEGPCTHPSTDKIPFGTDTHTAVCKGCGAFWQEPCSFVPVGSPVDGMSNEKCACGNERWAAACMHIPNYTAMSNEYHRVTPTCTCPGKEVIEEPCTMVLVREDQYEGGYARYYQCALCGNYRVEGKPRECEDAPDGQHSFASKAGEPGESWTECEYCHAVRDYKNDNLKVDPDCKHGDYETYEKEIVHATHKQAGRKYVCCKKCDSVLSTVICPPLNGECAGKLLDKTDPGCGPEDYGYEYYECVDEKCGEKWTVKLDPVVHTYSGQWEDVGGRHVQKCRVDASHEMLTGEHRYDSTAWSLVKGDDTREENFCLDCHHRIVRSAGQPEPTPTPTPVLPEPPVEIDVPDVPLAEPELPEEPDVEIEVPDVPLAELPEEPGEEVEIDEPGVPLADVPETGDHSLVWGSLTLISGTGLALLALEDRKRRSAGK